MKPQLSIVIPTHNRPDILKQCLEHIARQTIVDQLEVIVVHDGATSHQPLASSDWKFSFHFFDIPKSQQGIARNRGVEKAKADHILFIGDDIFLMPDACEKHLVASGQWPVTGSVLGHTTWDPACHITPVMRWLEASGWQFGYPMIGQYAHKVIPPEIQHRFTYTSHISLPTDTAKKYPFREDVSLYGWEDILWGTELRDAGVQLMYEPDAKALHHHHIELEDSLKRMEVIGKSLQKMKDIDPDFDRIPTGWKLWAHQLMALMPTMRGTHERAFMAGFRAD